MLQSLPMGTIPKHETFSLCKAEPACPRHINLETGGKVIGLVQLDIGLHQNVQ